MRAFLAASLLCLLAIGGDYGHAYAGPFSRFDNAGPGGHGAPWLNQMMREVGRNPTGWRSKWCGRYVAMRVPGQWSNLAIANAKMGRPSGPRPGAVAVMNHHVGVIGPKGCSGGVCQIVSGNGRGGKVDVKNYRQSRIVAYRWPA